LWIRRPGRAARDRNKPARVRSPSIGDRSQQVVFEKVVQDLLEDDPEIRRTAASRLDEVYDEEEEGEVEFESLLDENL